MRTEVRAPAKINLGLKILGTRADGYHDIVSIFQEISIYDLLEIETARGSGNIHLTCTDDNIPSDESNLAFRAARIFLESTGEMIDISIILKKNIRSRAGLGGGSSDAASVLMALEELTGRTDFHLMRAAMELGSDVPFFLSGGAARVTGRGERIERIGEIPFHAVLIHPEASVSTPWAYGLWDSSDPLSLTNDRYIRHYSASSAVWHEGKPFPHDLRNDFLPLLEKNIPEISLVAEFLRDSDCRDWGLSGSGPTFYALFRSEREAMDFSSGLQWETSICKTAETAGASSNG